MCRSAALPTPACAQTDQTTEAQLLGKAHALEMRSRNDIQGLERAKQVWQQVLNGNPRQPVALAGMARANKLEGRPKDAEIYLSQLRAIDPGNPEIQRIETMSTIQDDAGKLQEARRLADAKEYARALAVQREVYGGAPPPGDAALGYYETEAAVDADRPHAIAGLRALIDKYPQDSRYQVLLGRILIRNPRTRAEGRKLLERHPNDAQAQEALRDALAWEHKNPASATAILMHPERHADSQLAGAQLAGSQPANAPVANETQARRSRPVQRATPLTLRSPGQRAAPSSRRAMNAEQRAAYAALNARQLDVAEGRFKALHESDPQDFRSTAGLGYVQMSRGNFSGAVSFFGQAVDDGDRDPAVEKALRDSRFYYVMQLGTAALNANNLQVAEQEFQEALTKRPSDPSALQGLGGTLLKGQQNDRAVEVFTTYVRVAPGDEAAWRGLLMAESGAGKYTEALSTERRIPPAVKARLLRDPDYLRTVASTYLALGRDADAERVLRGALDLPFPAGGAGLKTDVQLQYAALLSAANRKEQAIGLYQQVLAQDPKNANAWIGLVQNQHQLGQDAAAYEAIRTMPAESYNAAMQEAGFETTVAAVYEDQGHEPLAQQVLERFLASQQAQGKQPFVPAEIQLAGIYMRHGDSARAYTLYKSVLQNNGDSAAAWNGLLGALHATGHDAEALTQLQAIPPAVRKELESNPSYLETVGSIYAGLGDSQEALQFFARVQQHYAAEHVQPPAELDVQEAWLLYNSRSDAALLRHLLALGDRKDLTAPQRLTVQTIWANFAVRRANQVSAAGNYRLAVAILNAAARIAPGNQEVLRTLAGGYASAGMPKEAVAIFKAQNLNAGSAGDYRAAVGAALAANDMRDAEMWLRFGLDQYPRDPQMLVLAARFEAARGDANRAAQYYRAALAVMPPGNPGAQLASEMAQPAPSVTTGGPVGQQSQDLATLLGQTENAGTPSRRAPAQFVPYLPSYTGGTGTSPMENGNSDYGAAGYGGAPARPRGTTLKDYVPPAPHSRLEPPSRSPGSTQTAAEKVPHLHADRAVEAKFGPYVAYDPARGVPHFVGARTGLGDGVVTPAGARQSSTTAKIATAALRVRRGEGAALHEARFRQAQQAQPTAPDQIVTAAPMFSPRPNPAPQPAPADGTPIVQYAPAARQISSPAPRRQVGNAHAPSAEARARAAAIRENQANATPQMMGVSHPPAESYETAPAASLNSAQYTTHDASVGQMRGQVPPPSRAGLQQGSDPYRSPQYSSQSPTPQQNGDSSGQQYPQPGTRDPGPSSHPPRRRRGKAAPVQPTPAEPAASPAPPQQPLQYPQYPAAQQPLENFGPPPVGSPVPLGQAPSDYQLQQHNLPPLRAYFDPRTDARRPLTERESAELGLAQIEGSYSGWLGGSAIGRYRSGTPGVDRLATLEVPFEASFVIDNTFRLSIIPKAVFLNSGTLNTNGGTLGTGPVLGTFLGSAPSNPSQQFASGVGGEVQLATNTFAVAVGTTPYPFLVTNLIGRGRWRPGNWHFTLYGGRDAVEETQLSYAGLRDPGTATTTYGGNVWGGVVDTGGGVRFESGDEHSGLYIQGEGSVLTGYHVLQNQKVDGLMGAYFRIKNWPEYGTLNIGGALYGEHFTYNERGETYGLGGYFSPEAYFLAAVPLTFDGHYGPDLHYSVNGSLGVQTFQEDNQTYFPLDPSLLAVAGCTSAQLINHSCGLPVNSNTGLNFSFDSRVSYRVNDHWYVGGLLAANNTNNYNTVSGGFFARYTFRPQYPTVDYPTGMFPVQGFRPLRVP